MAAIAKPLNSPLPPLPPQFDGPPLRSIPRRPVAAPVASPPALAPAPTSAQPEPSPVGSFSSLFSAYSNHTVDSPRSPPADSTKDMVGSKGAYSVVSPNLDTQRSTTQPGPPGLASAPLPSEQNAPKHQPSGHMFEAKQEELPPPPPPPPLKDAQRSIPRPRTPTGLHTQSGQSPTSARVGPPLGNGSPQQEQLWSRRSLKADKSLAVPVLKLVSSHGSTAASAQDTSQSGPSSLFSEPFPLPPTAPRAPPRSAIGGLPGRNIRPVIASEQAASQAEVSMGQETSRIKEKLENVRRRGSGEADAKVKSQEAQASHAAAMLSPAASAVVSPLSSPRLPTPEYGTNDVKSPLSNTVVSPLSPLSPALSLDLPVEPKPITRKALGVTEAQLRHARSSPSLAPGPINTGLSVPSPVGLPSCPRPDLMKQTQPLPAVPAPDRTQMPSQPQYRAYSPAASDQSQGPNQKQYVPYSPPNQSQGLEAIELPALSPSRDGQDQRPLPAPAGQEPLSVQPTTTTTNQRDPWTTTQTPTTREPIPRTFSETGSIETVKPIPVYNNTVSESLPPLREPDSTTTTTNPGAARFPRGWYTTPSPADAIPDARPLTDAHYLCRTQHRYLTANRQRTNPVACRVCGHKDRNAECHICSACYLNVCAGCAGLVRRFRGDLAGVLGEVLAASSSSAAASGAKQQQVVEEGRGVGLGVVHPVGVSATWGEQPVGGLEYLPGSH
ncbi:hypothetical protein C8A00DRAFT_29023 [Chaetomidium leptoderma]|uniref:Uncharacterized protein n=1 Tax=Chaetomidium leptoderma TaxID=669021 RepID=A0AAN6VUB0_9PEZI|nr:hypothetical protein C8A00DRAFT_29023 [Chaetomidium leptoderma]